MLLGDMSQFSISALSLIINRDRHHTLPIRNWKINIYNRGSFLQSQQTQYMRYLIKESAGIAIHALGLEKKLIGEVQYAPV